MIEDQLLDRVCVKQGTTGNRSKWVIIDRVHLKILVHRAVGVELKRVLLHS
jgi:hypothetical protein